MVWVVHRALIVDRPRQRSRNEQTFVTDQDNMIIYDEADRTIARSYYEEFGARVVKDWLQRVSASARAGSCPPTRSGEAPVSTGEESKGCACGHEGEPRTARPDHPY